MLEYAVAVSETAFSIGEPARCAVYSIKAFHRMDQIGGLDTVCPDILNCRSTHFTRNTGEVLDSLETVLQTPRNKIGPLLTSSGYCIHRVLILVITGYPLYPGMQDEAVEIITEEQIASASDVKDLVADKFIGTRDFQQLLL